MRQEIIMVLVNLEEWIAWKHDDIERRVRKEGNLFCLYDVRWGTKEVAFYGYDATYGAIRFARHGYEFSHFCTGLPSHTNPHWKRQIERKIRKRLFFNKIQPRLWRLKALRGGKAEAGIEQETIALHVLPKTSSLG